MLSLNYRIFSQKSPIFAALLFGAGRAYRTEFLARFGFDDFMMPWSVQDITYLGGITQSYRLIQGAMFALIGIAVFLLCVTAMAFALNKLRTRLVRNWRKSVRRSTNVELLNPKFLDGAQLLTNSLGSAYLIAFWAILFFVVAEEAGGDDAEKQLQAIKASDSGKKGLKLRYVVIERVIDKKVVVEKGYVVTCSERVCGIYSPHLGNEAARVVPLDNVLSMRYVR